MKIFIFESLIISCWMWCAWFTLTKGQHQFISLTPALLRKSMNACHVAANDPYFEPNTVSGEPWRIIYTWNMLMEDKCVDITFKPSTPELIKRIYYDTHLALVEQPVWDFATLVMVTGSRKQQMLLIPYNNIAGRFHGVNDDINGYRSENQVPLLRVQLKLLRNSIYLLYIDCQVGVAWLGVRFNHPIYRVDVESVTDNLTNILGEGNHACLIDKQLDENVVMPEGNKRVKPNFMLSSPQEQQ